MATVLVVYPSGPDFDLKYYLATHMPLVGETWGPHGLKGWDVVSFEPGSAYQIQATLKWESLEHFEKASTGPTASVVFGDIPNFTTAKPDVLKGSVQASAQVN